MMGKEDLPLEMDRGASHSAGVKGESDGRTLPSGRSTMEESLTDSPRNDSLFNDTENAAHDVCPATDTNVFLVFSYLVFSALSLFPLSVWILFIGCRRNSLSHSDVLTLHMCLVGVLSMLAVSLMSYGIYAGAEAFTAAGVIILLVCSTGQITLQNLACVERYLAVVHPVVYLRLKTEAGRKVRDTVIACVWILSLSWIPILIFSFPIVPKLPFLIQALISLLLITFCCLSVICVLRQSGPVGDTVHLDKTKRRAFHTLLAVTAVLLLYVLGIVVCCGSDLAMRADTCLLVFTAMWFSVPSQFALPLFFLQKVGKLLCFK